MEKLSPDQWAEKKGLLDAVGRLLLAGAKHHNHWVEGDLLDEQAFDEGWAAYASLPVGR